MVHWSWVDFNLGGWGSENIQWLFIQWLTSAFKGRKRGEEEDERNEMP